VTHQQQQKSLEWHSVERIPPPRPNNSFNYD